MAGNQHAAQVIKTEEKGSDVNLAVHLLNDSWLDVYDCAVVVSNDSDIAEAMRLARHHHGKLIGLITPLFGTKWGFPSGRETVEVPPAYLDQLPGRRREGLLPLPWWERVGVRGKTEMRHAASRLDPKVP